MTHDLVVLGDLVADLIIPVQRLPIMPNQHGWAEGIFTEPGGAGNVLVAARRVNLSAVTLAAVGNDRYGHDILSMLAAEGVDINEVAILDGRMTVVCMVFADQMGQHVYLAAKDQHGLWPFPAEWHRTIQRARALFTDGYTLRDVFPPEEIFQALDKARQAGVKIFFDPGPSIAFLPAKLLARVLAATDALLLTDEEAELLNGPASVEIQVRTLLGRGPSAVVLKHGAAGCTVATEDAIITHSGFPVSVVDTVGAGDSFAAAFIAGWLRGGSLLECATLANAMGALTTTQRAAGTRIPPRERLLELLADAPSARALA